MPKSPKKRSQRAPIKQLSHSGEALRYAKQVVSGKIAACRWVLLACQRHLNDLDTSRARGARYKYDEDKANRVCRFIEALPHTKGKWAADGENIRLQPWQKFIICSLFGWIERATGNYRFREAYVCVPRKNGKSVLGAAIGEFKFAADQEHGAEVYSGATTEKQAWEVFRVARLMAQNTPALRDAFGITVNAQSLTIASNGSRFEPVIGKPGDGASPSCAIVDEYHEHTDDVLYDTMKTGMGARENPLLLVITTAGSDRSGPCFQLQEDGQKVLQGTVRNDRWFVIIYTIDEGDKWDSEAALIKANPNYDVSVKADHLAEQVQAALATARKQNIVKNKHLNIWTNVDVGWMNMAAWDKCCDRAMNIEDFTGQECVIGLDLAQRIDIASKVLVFKKVIDDPEKPHFYVFAVNYQNQEQVDRPQNTHYAGWAHEGYLVVTPGNTTDFNYIADDLIKDSKRFRIRQIPHDPALATTLIQFIQGRKDWDQDVEFVEITQTVMNLSPAMKETEALVIEGRLHHNGDPALAWMMSNVVCHTDRNDNIFPNKQRAENKIDAAVALMMPIGAWMKMEPESNGDYLMVFDPTSAVRGAA